MLAEAAAIGAAFGYDEINLNVGCPSDRVQQATFGACLMARPRLVADCVRAMRAAVAVPVTVKCRIGIDDRDDWPFLRDFVAAIAEAGCGDRHRARAQGDPEGTVAEAEPRGPAARLRACLAGQAGVPVADGRRERRPAHGAAGDGAAGARGRRDARPRGVPQSVPAAGAAPRSVRRRLRDADGARRSSSRMRAYAEREVGARHAAARDHAAHARPVQRARRGARLAARAVRGREPRQCRRRR